jgi:N-acetylmuramoyl-L-alanine amidase
MKILVSAGHGGTSPGASYFGHTEAALMLELRNYVSMRLLERGHAVMQDGGDHENLPLPEAVKLIKGMDVAIELHTNAAPGGAGVELVSLPRHKAQAQKIARAIGRALSIPVRRDGGWMRQEDTPHGSLAFVRAGGMVVEVFFLSNRDELDRYLKAKHDVAEAIAEALSESA